VGVGCHFVAGRAMGGWMGKCEVEESGIELCSINEEDWWCGCCSGVVAVGVSL
jgi:hypothetical protein